MVQIRQNIWYKIRIKYSQINDMFTFYLHNQILEKIMNLFIFDFPFRKCSDLLSLQSCFFNKISELGRAHHSFYMRILILSISYIGIRTLFTILSFSLLSLNLIIYINTFLFWIITYLLRIPVIYHHLLDIVALMHRSLVVRLYWSFRFTIVRK